MLRSDAPRQPRALHPRPSIPLCARYDGSLIVRLLPWADVFTFNGEAEMLRYRLALHSSFVTASVIIESNVTFTGRQKRPSQLASRILTDAERRRVERRRCSSAAKRGNSHVAQPGGKGVCRRRFATSVIAQRPRHRVYHSDVDELLDPAAMHSLEVTTCIAPRLRFYYYSEHCPVYNETWAGAIIVNTATKWFVDRASGTPPVMMRAHPGTDLARAQGVRHFGPSARLAHVFRDGERRHTAKAEEL